MHKIPRFLNLLRVTLIIFLLCASIAWAGPRAKVLHSFTGGSDGTEPYGIMILDGAGNLYGVTQNGGSGNFGTVFKLTPSGSGWIESIIFNFSTYPGYGLTFDSSGNLYGTFASSGSIGCGSIYQLVPSADGTWTENILYSFSGSPSDGCLPQGGLTFDPSTGNLYGTTQAGGASNAGTVFELAPAIGGGWTYNSIYSFLNNGRDAAYPQSSLTLDSAGNIYGTSNGGGAYDAGAVYKLTNSGGDWRDAVLFSFTGGYSGGAPLAGVIFDKAGNLYGTMENGGGDAVGNIYKLTPTRGVWAIHIIHTFTGGPDGAYPSPFNLAIDNSGNLYGTTLEGGLFTYGTIYKLTFSTDDKWIETVLHSFTNGIDGGYPYCGVTLDTSGHLFGTTSQGGTGGYGIVFAGTP